MPIPGVAAAAGLLDIVGRVSLPSGSASGDDGSASLQIASNGKITGLGNILGFGPSDWVIPNSAAGNNFEVRATVSAGDTPSGSAVGTWLPLGTTRTWTVTTGQSSTLLIEVRRVSGGTLDSESYAIAA